VVAHEHLVVVLPGIGGTQLAVPDRFGRPTETLIWSASPGDLDLLRNPEPLSINVHPRLAPAGLIPTRKAFGLWTVVHGYDGLLRRLAKRHGAVLDDGTGAPNPDATVVAVGYDFRLGVADAAEHLDRILRPRLEHRWPKEDDRAARVIVVAHSMGGLVARYWAACLDGARWCRAIITLGTPHRGAPKALDVMANGIRVGPTPLRLTSAIALAREWQGIADLLPRYPAVLDHTGHDTRTRYRPHELPLPWLTGPATRAHEMHTAIEMGWARLATAPAMFPRIGFGHGTLRTCSWDGSEIRVTTDMPDGDDVGGWSADLGDGTVPAYCGLPVEMDNHPRENLRTHRRHGPIAELKEVVSLLDALDSDAPLSAFRADGDDGIGLGLDLEDVHLTGAEMPIAVRTVGDPVMDPVDAAVWASVYPIPDRPGTAPGKRPEPVKLEWDVQARVFRGLLPAQRPGLAEVTVQAPSLSNAPAIQTVEVIDDAGLD
jgi:hypothetical protein